MTIDTNDIAAKVAEKALNEYEYQGRTLKEWVDLILTFEQIEQDKVNIITDFADWLAENNMLVAGNEYMQTVQDVVEIYQEYLELDKEILQEGD